MTELFVQGRRAGFEFDLRPSAPAYLHDAAAWAADATRLPLLPDTEPADPSPGPAGVDLVGAEGTAPGASVRLHDAAAWA
ncbi:MAG: hypothetical protein LBK95_05485, partial [Bifidobacteriaceae bacterium]|nr:hypothetical protein [Bifidobacteriaceae bacterium]